MRLALLVCGAALLTVGCKAEQADQARGAEPATVVNDTNFAGKDDRVIVDNVQEKAPGAIDGDGGPDGSPPPGAQPQLNPEAQDPKGRGPRDPRMVPGSPASEKELKPPADQNPGSPAPQGGTPKR